MSEGGRRSILIWLYVAYLLAFADRVIFAVALQPIKETLGLDDAQLGLLAGAAFALSYAAFSPVAGWIMDRGAVRSTLAAGVAVWSAATLATAFAGSFVIMALARIAVGLGEAALQPAAVILLGGKAGGDERRAARFAVYVSAGAVGALAAMIGGGVFLNHLAQIGVGGGRLIADLAPWRWLFIAAGLPGFILAASLLVVLPRASARPAVPQPPGSVLGFLRGQPLLSVGVIVGMTLIQLGTLTTGAWAVVFLERVHGWPTGQAALRFGLTSGVALFVGCLLSAPLMRVVRARGVRAAPMVLTLIAAVGFLVPVLLALRAPSGEAALTLMAVGFLWGYAPLICTFEAIAEVTPPSLRARMTGLNILADGIICSMLGPLMVGVFSHLLFPGPNGIAAALGMTLILTTGLGVVLILAALRPYARAAARA